jgi:hypothetical protein
MNAFRKLIIAAFILGSAFASHAITNTVINVSGTNIVLSWPSFGYETYMIEYRQTLSPTDSWSQLTNDYYANSTNMTTFTLYGLASPPPSSGGGSGGSGSIVPPPSPDEDMARAIAPTIPMATPADGSGSPVPLAIFPPGFNMTGYDIFDPSTSQWESGSGYTISARPMDGGGFTPDDSTNDATGSETGFFRVFHIPDWLVSFDGYQFNGPTFIPVDFASPDAPTNMVDTAQVLLNGQPTDLANLVLGYPIDGTTYAGMGIYFDRMPNGTNTIQLLSTIRQSDILNADTPFITFSNAPQQIVINNYVNYTNWSDLIYSNSYTFAAHTQTNVNWEIDIYDENGDFVNSETNYSADGNISWTWDLTDSRSDCLCSVCLCS